MKKYYWWIIHPSRGQQNYQYQVVKSDAWNSDYGGVTIIAKDQI